jgi:DNA-binding transcriptional LysR family regulator
LVEREDVLLEEMVMNGELDCAIVTAWGSPRVATTRILTEEILLLLPKDHRLAGGSPVSLTSLADEPIVLPGHSMNMSNLLMDVCRDAGFEPKVPYRASYVELTKALVRQGLGTALVPRMFVTPEDLDSLVVVSLVERPLRSLDLIYLREHPVSTAARALMAHIRSSVTDNCRAESH